MLDKTCWYSAIHPCRIGALLGSGGRADLDAIARFGFFLGAVLQIRDDVENLTDRAESNGKDFGSDIIEGKPTLMLIHLLQRRRRRRETRRWCWLGGQETARAWVATSGSSGFSGLVEDRGSIDYACAFADGIAGAALAEFAPALGGLPESRDKAFLRSLVLHLRDPAIRGR